LHQAAAEAITASTNTRLLQKKNAVQSNALASNKMIAHANQITTVDSTQQSWAVLAYHCLDGYCTSSLMLVYTTLVNCLQRSRHHRHDTAE
jgi:hypothetical protein